MNAAQTAGMTRASLSVQSNLSSLAGSDTGGNSQILQHGVSRQSLTGGAGDAVTQQISTRSTTSVSRAVSVASFKEIIAEANCTTYVAIVVAMMGALMFGIDQGNFGLASEFQSFYDYWCSSQKKFVKTGFSCIAGDHPYPTNWTQFQSWGGSLITIGAALGSVGVGPWLSSNFGRRLCICVGGMICFWGCMFASFLAMQKIPVYFCGRFVTGFGAGICCFALPIYNSEIATPSTRGLTGSLFQFMVVVGGVIASFVLASITDWRLGMLLPGLAGLSVSLLIWLTPESPRFSLDKYGEDEGRRMLTKVRKNNCEPELQAMKRQAEEEAREGEISYGHLLSNRNSLKRVFIACYLQIAQQLTGVNAFLSYTTTIFEGANVPKEKINAIPGYAIYFNLLMLVGCVIGLLLIDSEYGGRRIQLLGATVIMGPPLLIAGISNLSGGPGWIAVAALFLYGPGFQVAWGIIPWIYPSEIFAMNEKEKAVGLATFFVFTLNFIINMITPSMLEASAGWTFVFFGLLNISNFIFVFVFIKETKGVAPEDIKALFDGRRDRTESYPQAREVSMSGNHA